MLTDDAIARCVPNPTQAGGTTTCSGIEDRGLIVGSLGSTVVVDAGAVVRPGPNAAAALLATAGTNERQAPAPSTITIGGTVDGGTDAAGIVVQSANSVTSGKMGDTNAQIRIVVAATGRITGTSGIRLNPVGQEPAFSSANLDNSGVIQASQGPAILSTDLSNAGFLSIVNRSGGTIGGIVAPVGQLTNAGTIDGSSGTALTTSTSIIANSFPTITNTGTITSSGTETIVDRTSFFALTNSGTVANTAAGTALQLGQARITNESGATITARGGTGIAASFLELVNRGRIVGTLSATDNSTIDSIGGTIEGDVRLGAGNDVVLATLDSAGAVTTGITGQLDGGGGTNELRITFDRSTTLRTLPSVASFQRIGVALHNKATVTLAPDYANGMTTVVSGEGTIVNQARITTDGTAFTGNQTGLALSNNGSITSTLAAGQSALSFEQILGSVALTNSGTISGNGGNGVALSAGGSIDNPGRIQASGTAVRTSGSVVNNRGIVQSTNGIAIDAAASRLFSGNVINSGTVNGEAVGILMGGNSLTNSGVIQSRGIGVQTRDNLSIDNLAGGIISGAVAAIASTGQFQPSRATIRNAGRIDGNVNLAGSTNNRFEALPGGLVNGNLYLGDGNDTFVTDLGSGPGFSGISGTVSGGGNETLIYRVSGNATASLATNSIFSRIGYQLAGGTRLTLTGSGPAFTLPVTFEGSGTVDLSATLSQTDRTIISFGAIDLINRGSLSQTVGSGFAPAAIEGLGSVNNLGRITVSAATAASGAAAILGPSQVLNGGAIAVAGADAVRNARVVQNSGTITQIAPGPDARGVVGAILLSNDGTIVTNGDSVLLNPLLPIGIPAAPIPLDVRQPALVNRGTIISNGGIAVSSPAFAATISNGAGALIKTGSTQPAIFVAGGTVIRNEGRIEGDIRYSIEDGIGYAYDGSTFRKAVLTSPLSSTLIGGGDTRLAPNLVDNGGTITGSVAFGDAADRFENRGLVGGSINLGGGDDTFADYPGGRVGGLVDGGAGTDTLALYSAGTDASPSPFLLKGLTSYYQGYANFEILAQMAGVTGFYGGSFDQVLVLGGRLIGLYGALITARDGIIVAPGASFGSTGTVIGNIAVAGTFRPGPSPGTMRVIGNVALAAGSNTVLELSPAASDQIVISGTLGIANGATLTVTGTSTLGTPPLDLIVANGGIVGDFTSVNLASTVPGFLRQMGDRLQLVGRFSTAGLTPQATSAANYLSDLLAAGPGSAALRSALPALVTTSGGSDGRALARITPEAYASATQITIENGLTLAKAARSITAAGRTDEPGAFTFAQGLVGWRSFNGDDAYGTSRFEQNSYGMLGGIGFGTETISVGGFVGYLKTFQKSPALNARTDADGVVAGAIGRAALDGFTLSTMVAYDGSRANTRRTLSAGRATSRYDLDGWTGDASLGYAVPLNANWAVKPEAGVTFVSSRRQGASETGSPFALNIARRKAHATFADAGLTLTGGLADAARVHPWATLGLRHQLDGRATFALAGFQGSTGTLGAIGVRRQATLATFGAGLSADLSRRIGIFAAYRGEFGGRGTGAASNAGIRIRF